MSPDIASLAQQFWFYLFKKRNSKTKSTSLPAERNLDKFIFNSKDLEDFLTRFKRPFTKSGMYNLINHYKGPRGFAPASLARLFAPNEDLQLCSWDLAMGSGSLSTEIDKKVLGRVATLVSKECKFVGWLNKNFLNRLFNIDSSEIDKVFDRGATLLAKLVFFFNKLHKQKVKEDMIMLLVRRVDRFSFDEQKISNLFFYVKPRNVTFSNISQKNNLLKFNMQNLNMLAIGLNQNKKAKLKPNTSFDRLRKKSPGGRARGKWLLTAEKKGSGNTQNILHMTSQITIDSVLNEGVNEIITSDVMNNELDMTKEIQAKDHPNALYSRFPSKATAGGEPIDCNINDISGIPINEDLLRSEKNISENFIGTQDLTEALGWMRSRSMSKKHQNDSRTTEDSTEKKGKLAAVSIKGVAKPTLKDPFSPKNALLQNHLSTENTQNSKEKFSNFGNSKKFEFLGKSNLYVYRENNVCSVAESK